MPNPSDEVKAKLDIVEVIREYIPLKAAGLNFRANCPFHREKTPSFMVSPEKQIWHCFGCGKGGDLFSFVMEMESLSFVETLRLLAKKAGVTLKKADPALTSKRNVLLDIAELAAKFYHKILVTSPAAEAARAYLKTRGLTEETIDVWQLGYSPNAWDILLNFLKNKGFGENEIFLAGLSVKKDRLGAATTNAAHANGNRYSGFYDRFRDRIMFPINDLNGNVVGFTARVNPAKEATEKMGKYINTPATMVYDKSKILFGLDKARISIKAEDGAILVEGQMDCITAHQNNFKNVIATSGTALTAEQVSLIKRYTNNLYLSFDMDKAGDLASERGIAMAMQAEMQIKVIEIQGAKDPDEFIKKNPAGWTAAVKAAKPVMQYYFDKTFAKFSKTDYEGQRQSLNILLPVIAKFGSKIEQDFWLKKLCQEIDAKENYLREKLDDFIAAGQKAAVKKATAPASVKSETKPEPGLDIKSSREDKLSETLLALGLRYPAHLEYIINHLSPEDLTSANHSEPPSQARGGNDYRLLYKNLIIYYNKLIDFWTHEGGNFDLSINYLDLKDWLSHPENLESDNQTDNEMVNSDNSIKCASLLDRLVLLADKDFYDYTAEQAKAEIINLVAVLRVSSLAKRRQRIIKLITAAEKEDLKSELKTEKLKGLMEEFKVLTEEIKMIEIK